MSALLDSLVDTFPANGDDGVPLRAVLTVTLAGLDYDTASLEEGLFVEGPDTDQYVGPGGGLLLHPDNISQGDPDDVLESPGRQGIVNGSVSVSGIDGDTVLSFSPASPLAALVEYRVNLTGVLASDGVTEIEGFVTFTFVTGSGSIEEIPSNISTSIISQLSGGGSTSVTEALEVVSITPADHAVQQSPDLDEIIIEFNKDLDPETALSASVIVETEPVTDHPGVSITSTGKVATRLEVEGKKLKIKI